MKYLIKTLIRERVVLFREISKNAKFQRENCEPTEAEAPEGSLYPVRILDVLMN